MKEYTVDQSLNIDPFFGEERDGEVTLSDKIVKAAKKHEKKCQICRGDIQKGERHRVLVETGHGTTISTRFCAACCIALAKSTDDAGKEWEARTRLHEGILVLTNPISVKLDNGIVVGTGEAFIEKSDAVTLNEYVRESMPELSLILDIQSELKRARTKFPGKNVTFAAMVEEVGELSTALFEESRQRVREEAIQVAVMAMRVVLDGDHTFDSWRKEKGLDNLT